MAKLQKQMTDFHEKIRLQSYKENRALSEKRDLLHDALRQNLNKDDRDPKLSYSSFNQGSYAIHTGTKPLHKSDDYDIDVGLVFDLNEEEHSGYISDPVELKKRIKKALDIPQRVVNIRRPCVTVQYIKNGENDYHVDLAVYRENPGSVDHLDLARGKEGSASEYRYWDENDPKGLISAINERFPGESNKEQRSQMRRCIRYLKRWRDRQFSNGAVPSIALTCSAYHWFNPFLEYIPGKNQVPNDQIALKDLATTILSQESNGRIPIHLPVSPFSDLLDNMTGLQMGDFINKLASLKEALEESITLACPHEAAKRLQKQFGDEFDVPDKESTGEKSKPAIVPVGSSA